MKKVVFCIQNQQIEEILLKNKNCFVMGNASEFDIGLADLISVRFCLETIAGRAGRRLTSQKEQEAYNKNCMHVAKDPEVVGVCGRLICKTLSKDQGSG